MIRSRARGPFRWTALALAAVLVPLVGCASKVATRSFEVAVAPDANRDSPVPVDLVLVRTEALVPVVTAMSAKQWFQEREQMVKDHPAALEYRSWEFVPGQVRDMARFPFPDRRGFALVVFADYLSEGVHRLRVDPMEEFRLILRAEGFEAQAIR